MLRRVSQVLTPSHHPTALHPLSLALNIMSSFAAAPPDNPSLEQLTDEADALTAESRHEQAYLVYQHLFDRLLVMFGEDSPVTLAIMFDMGCRCFIKISTSSRIARSRKCWRDDHVSWVTSIQLL
jgi:hypothetical protein